MLDTNQDYNTCATELQVTDENVGQLITPLTRFSNRNRKWFAIDNGAYKRFNAQAFLSIIEREKQNKERCKFIVVPDIPMSALRTLELFEYWHTRLGGWRIALACQDGQENLGIPWAAIDAVFIAGSTKWKMSSAAYDIVKTAKAMGKWTHVGRVNGPIRAEVCNEWGVDSVDGSGISQYSHMRKRIGAYMHHPKLYYSEE